MCACTRNLCLMCLHFICCVLFFFAFGPFCGLHISGINAKTLNTSLEKFGSLVLRYFINNSRNAIHTHFNARWKLLWGSMMSRIRSSVFIPSAALTKQQFFWLDEVQTHIHTHTQLLNNNCAFWGRLRRGDGWSEKCLWSMNRVTMAFNASMRVCSCAFVARRQ